MRTGTPASAAAGSAKIRVEIAGLEKRDPLPRHQREDRRLRQSRRTREPADRNAVTGAHASTRGSHAPSR